MVAKIIYSTRTCPACVRLKAEYKRNHQEYNEIVIGVDITLEDFQKKFPGVKTVPHVVNKV